MVGQLILISLNRAVKLFRFGADGTSPGRAGVSLPAVTVVFIF